MWNRNCNQYATWNDCFPVESFWKHAAYTYLIGSFRLDCTRMLYIYSIQLMDLFDWSLLHWALASHRQRVVTFDFFQHKKACFSVLNVMECFELKILKVWSLKNLGIYGNPKKSVSGTIDFNYTNCCIIMLTLLSLVDVQSLWKVLLSPFHTY